MLRNNRQWTVQWFETSTRAAVFLSLIVAVVATVAVVTALHPQTVFGQAEQPSQTDGWLVDAAQRTNAVAFSNALKAGRLDPTSSALISGYAGRYYFHRWTSRANVAQLNNFVKDFDTDMKAAVGDAKGLFLLATHTLLKRMAEDPNVTPQARYIAMYQYSLLNPQERPKRPDGSDAPVPNVLTVLIDSAKNAQLPDAVRLAAILGVVRYAQNGIADADVKNQAEAVFRTFAAETSLPKDRPEELHTWFRLRAVEGLGALKSVGPNGSVLDSLVTILNDNTADTELRIYAARAIGDLDFSPAAIGQTKIDAASVAISLLKFAHFLCGEEKEFIDSQRRRLQVSSSSGSSMSGGGSSGFMASYDTTESGSGLTLDSNEKRMTEWSMARIKFAFTSILNAINGGRPISAASATAATPGILPLLTTDVSSQQVLRNGGMLLIKFNRFLDEGTDDMKKAELAAKAAAKSSSSSSSDGSSTTTSAATTAAKDLKVNTTLIQDELEILAENLAALTASPSQTIR